MAGDPRPPNNVPSVDDYMSPRRAWDQADEQLALGGNGRDEHVQQEHHDWSRCVPARSVGLTRWCAPPQLAGSGGQLLDTASAVSQSLHDLKAPRTVKFAPRRTPAHPAAALSAALSKCSPFWVALHRAGRLLAATRAKLERGARSDRRGRSTASPAVSYSIAELLLLLVATRGAQPEMHRKAARC